MSGQTCYIIGAMNGEPDHGFPPFFAAAAQLRSEGWEAQNPAENVPQAIKDEIERLGDRCDAYFWAMKRDTRMVLRSDALFALPRWLRSKGAKHEALTADICGIPVYDYVTRHQLDIPSLVRVQLTGLGAREHRRLSGLTGTPRVA